ncbi:type II secretory pathway predicted ATPase ExeA [Thiogranum longum]|uniref:Type II secretory pathway predicted ATPase ExeA n=1 Tax=Thiogranum longum TaxID=1537524 RepID=A0A4R1HMM0_9GAMM|nr:AAA family ATPase [Thiogranum longum]TCK18492.1 type II secretory pathway predicted ATPase ExeA [Thiogranum longum]
MYEQLYGFSERPFSLLPDPDFLFLGEKHRAALDTLELAIFNQSGFCVISGEIGAGKTTLVRELLNRLDGDTQVGLVSNTHPSFGELMQWVMTAYGLPGGSDNHIELHKRFIDFAIQRYAQGKRTLLIIDEAQNLSMEALEELRMLSNVNSEKDLVLQIIMIGQNELRDKLRSPELAQFAQRISMDYYLGGLDADETCLYIQHRVTHAGGAADLFTRDACQRVFEFSQGIPRVINRLCDLSLVYGYAQHREHIGPDVIEAVAQEQQLGKAMEEARQRAAVIAPEEIPVAAAEKEVPAQVHEPEQESSKPQPELSAEPVRDANVRAPADKPEKVVSSDLHKLVVNAEKTHGSRGERSALWLFVAVVVMVGATAWASREAWLPGWDDLLVSGEKLLSAPVAPKAANVPVAAENKGLAEKARQEQLRFEKARREKEARLAKQRAAEQAKQEQAQLEKARREKEARLAKQRAAEQAKQEQAKLEKARREKEARLAKQRAAEQAKQEQAKLEKARREEEARLAKQRAAEQAKQEQAQLEKARREKEARLAKQRAAEQAKQEQAKLEKARREQAERENAVPTTAVRPVSRSRTPVPAGWTNTLEWSEEDDDELPVETPVEETAVAPPSETPRLPETTVSTALTGEKEDPDNITETEGFATNPCNGPTARFLSTCR